MYLNPFFSFRIIFGLSRPGIFTAAVFPYRGPNKLQGVFFVGVGAGGGGGGRISH